MDPGVPPRSMEDGFHFLRFPETGVLTIGEWSPDAWGWVISYHSELVGPEALAHLDYVGWIKPPDPNQDGAG
jgi:hypothetical protein